MKENKPILFDDLLKKIPNKYLLTVIAGKRARDIMGSDEYREDMGVKDTIVKKVLVEILLDKLEIVDEK